MIGRPVAIHPDYFVLTKHLHKGDRVRFTVHRVLGQVGTETGEGVITLIWFGIEEMVDIEKSDGSTVHACLGTGDEIEIIEKGSSEPHVSR